MSGPTPLLPAPPLPGFIARQLPFDRGCLRLAGGPYPGRRLHLVDHGPAGAPVVLLLHGNPAWSFLWRRVIALLDGFRAVAPDLLGLGLSDHLPAIGDHSAERHAAALAELVEALGIERFVLVGQDWGGPLACALGARFPGRVAGLVLGNTSVLMSHSFRGSRFHRLARLPLLSDLLFRGLGFPQCVLGRVQGDPRSIRGDVARAYRWPLRGWRRRVAPLALARMVPDSPDHPTVEVLRRGEAWARGFGGPMALVWGCRDPILGRALRRHVEAFPDARLWRTEAGHFLQEEVPEALAEAIRWVAARATGSPID